MLQIAGVVRDSMARTIGESRVPVTYVPEVSRSLTIRVAHADVTRRSALQAAIRRLEPAGSAVSVRPFADEVTAARLGIAGMVLRDAIRVVTVGCLVGAVIAWLVSRAVETLIVGQAVVAPAMFAGVTCVLLLVGIAASLRPARRAAGADPVTALRCE